MYWLVSDETGIRVSVKDEEIGMKTGESVIYRVNHFSLWNRIEKIAVSTNPVFDVVIQRLDKWNVFFSPTRWWQAALQNRAIDCGVNESAKWATMAFRDKSFCSARTVSGCDHLSIRSIMTINGPSMYRSVSAKWRFGGKITSSHHNILRSTQFCGAGCHWDLHLCSLGWVVLLLVFFSNSILFETAVFIWD